MKETTFLWCMIGVILLVGSILESNKQISIIISTAMWIAVAFCLCHILGIIMSPWLWSSIGVVAISIAVIVQVRRNRHR